MHAGVTGRASTLHTSPKRDGSRGRAGEGRTEAQRCLEWHARWAVASCYPDDEHLEAHVRWARHFCTPEGDDVWLTERERRREKV